MISKVVKKSVEEFNKYRSPEATAKIISTGKKSLNVKFKGVFCKTCGFYDYFEDFRLILEERGLKTKTGKVREIGEGAKVEFLISK